MPLHDIVDRLRLRAAIYKDDGRIFLCRIESAGLDKAGVESSPVVRGDIDDLGGENFVLSYKSFVERTYSGYSDYRRRYGG